MTFATRFRQYEARRAIEESEQQRLAFLKRPPAPNPPELLTPTRVKVLRPFCVGGTRIEVGEIATLPRADADSLAFLGKCELVV